ncbi:hypothetical protein AN7670.2 [Paecilomyces variotii No. 5]|uniref:Uncharacterized protein n=1 Tax=Byssochlamys spectabilis (strain No. 5 / NBRC 109023) TaxID=1356009 RepID=V5G6P9_BYSSN|nr:hypothetical protein AN7670.2 [Paecilomyces variotii No. 5]
MHVIAGILGWHAVTRPSHPIIRSPSRDRMYVGGPTTGTGTVRPRCWEGNAITLLVRQERNCAVLSHFLNNSVLMDQDNIISNPCWCNLRAKSEAPEDAHLASTPRRQHSEDQLKRQAREQLEGLIKRHGHPTIVCSSSSLRSLTSTSPTGGPSYLPSPELCPVTTTVDTEDDTLCIVPDGTRPIPIPKPASTRELDDLPVTPLTGRFDEVHFLYAQQCPRGKDQKLPGKKRTRRPRVSSRTTSDHKMHTGGSTQLYTPSTMAQSGHPLSSQNTPKGASGIPLSLPRFHPAVYQSSTGAHSSSSRPSSPHQQRPQAYRMSSGSRDTLRQYRELITNGVLSRNAQGVITNKPAAPRLDPLGSPGPVTPLALEEGDSYLSAGAANGSEQQSSSSFAPSPELVEKLIQRENERIRLQKQRQELKGR